MEMKMKHVMAAGAMALLAGAMPAMAEDRGTRAGGPGLMRAMPEAEFATLDSDGDGRISREEWAQFRADHRAAMRERMIAARVEALFAFGDADDDAMLNRDELASAMASLQAERMENRAARREEREEMREEMREGRRSGMRGAMRHRARGEGRTERGWRGERMQGHIAGPEQRAERAFGRIDMDGDGFISPEEFAAAQERWAAGVARMERRMQRGPGGNGRGRANAAD